MSNVMSIDQQFGEIALRMAFVSREKLDRALVIQRCIFKRTRVHMPIGKVLKEMGVLDQKQVDAVLEAQRAAQPDVPAQAEIPADTPADPMDQFKITIAHDKLAAFISPLRKDLKNASIDTVKLLLAAQEVAFGVVDDRAIEAYLAQTPIPEEPFEIARGIPALEGRPPEVVYHFETDPLRIGTLKEDGTMDWKDRGDVPEVKTGDLLAEKKGGEPGKPGMSVCGQEIQPPRLREPQLKCTKGAQRSEDGSHVFAKIDGMPKITPDGRICVMALLPIKGDIGIETGHVEFDGYVEVEGGVSAGYTVKARGLQTREIQNSQVDISEDLVSFGGIYGSVVKVGGNLKASHIHNTELEVIGDLVVEKEIYGCNVEVSGRCILHKGKIIGSKIAAKKGIEVHDVGTEASLPSELTVGIDHKYEREMQAFKNEMEDLEKRNGEYEAAVAELKKQLDRVTTDLGETAQVQDKYMVQKRQFEEKLRGPKAVQDQEQRTMMMQLVHELNNKMEKIETQVNNLMQQDDTLRLQISTAQTAHAAIRERIEVIKQEMDVLEESQKVDPGLAVIKAGGMVYARTVITCPHKKMVMPQDMNAIRIAETKSEFGGNKWQIKITNLR